MTIPGLLNSPDWRVAWTIHRPHPALQELASYTQGATTAGIAAKIGYETEVVKEWLAQLNALN